MARAADNSRLVGNRLRSPGPRGLSSVCPSTRMVRWFSSGSDMAISSSRSKSPGTDIGTAAVEQNPVNNRDFQFTGHFPEIAGGH